MPWMSVYLTQGETLSKQFEEAGRVHKYFIQKSAAKKRRKWSIAHKERGRVLEKIFQRIKKESLFAEFYACLVAWSKGAEITAHEALQLLDDNTGCQTVMARFRQGVILIHTEEELEDIEARMTEPKIIGFRAHGKTHYCLVYNDLMPGAAMYAWSDNYAMAADSLFLREDGAGELQKPILANIVAWLMWRQAMKNPKSYEAEKVIRRAGEAVDGYAVNLIYSRRGELDGYKVSFTRREVEFEYLGKESGAVGRQVNILEPRYIEEGREIAKWQLPPRKFYKGYWRYYQERIKRLDHDIAQYQPFLQKNVKGKGEILKRIIMEITGPLAGHHLNEAVGAVSATMIGSEGAKTAVGLVKKQKLGEIKYF